MSNIIESLTARIEAYRVTNKAPCKSYTTQAKAQAVAKKIAATAAVMIAGENAEPARYVVFYVEAWGRWVCCFDMTELFHRQCAGGYTGVCGDHFTF